MRAYVTQDPTEKVVEFYKADPADPNCTMMTVGNLGLSLACKKDTLVIQLTVSPPTNKKPGTEILIQCSPQE